jgi:hypothetical protein
MEEKMTEYFFSSVGCKKLLHPISSPIEPIIVPIPIVNIIFEILMSIRIPNLINILIKYTTVVKQKGIIIDKNVFIIMLLLTFIFIGINKSLKTNIVIIYANVGANCVNIIFSKSMFKAC